MNGIRGRTSTSPPLHNQGQQSRNNYYTQIAGSDEYPQPQQLYSQNQYPAQEAPGANYYYQPPLGVNSGQYNDIGKQGMPRMPSPAMGTQPGAATSMYQPQQPGSIRTSSNAGNPPFYQPTQANLRPRFPNMPNQPNQGMYMGGVYMNPPQGHFMGQSPVIINPNMQIPGQRVQNPGPQFNHIASSQSGIYQMPPQQNINSFSQGFGNPPLYIAQQPPRPMTAPAQSQPQQQRAKRILSIIDPSTGKDLFDDMRAKPGDKPAVSAPESNSQSAPAAASSSGAGASAPEGPVVQQPPNEKNEIAAQFAALVAAKLYTSSASDAPMQQAPTNAIPKQPPTQPNVPPPSHMPPHQRMPNNAQMNDSVQNQMLPPTRPMGPPPVVLAGQQHSTPVNIPPGPVPHVHMDSSMMMGGPPVPPNSVECITMDGDSHGMSVESIESVPSDSAPVVNASITSLSSNSVPVVDSAPVGVQQGEKLTTNSTGDKPHAASGHATESSSKSTPVVSVKEPEPVVPSREPVTVSVEKAVSDSRTSELVEDVPSSSTKENGTPVANGNKREPTPEVNITPPTPVEKEAKTDYEAKAPEPVVQEVTSVPKKERGKKKAKDLNKKGDKIAGSEFDAYTDKTATKSTPPQEETKPVESPAVVTTPPPAAPSKPEVAKTTENVRSAAPAKPTPERESTPPAKEANSSDEAVKVDVKEVPKAVTPEPEQDDELEEGEIVDDDEDAMMDLRYKYAEDQWSPLNPEGKKHYDREFLLQFQFETSAVSKPAGLPDIPDVILDRPVNMGRQASRDMQGPINQQDSGYDFTPRYVWQPSGGGGGGGGRGSKNLPRPPSHSAQKKAGGGPGGNMGPVRQINVSISKDIELHHAKEAWKPGRSDKEKDKKEAGTEDEAAATEILYKKTRSILNKLTPQKFQKLVGQMQELTIDNEVKLKGTIDLVFEKAISEPNFSVAYANMCRCLSMNKVPSTSKPGEFVNFRAVLITQCQREFEKDKSSEALFIMKRKEIEEAEGEEKKTELRNLLASQESNAKRRSLGNIRFIGELFKLRMLTENIMHDCVFKLLRSKDPESLECLCRLLTTIGKELETDKARDMAGQNKFKNTVMPRMDQYFNQMTKIAADKKTASRVRFMLQDVIDLRLNKWVPRRKDNNPKTIDQIHREVEQEAQERALLSQQVQMQPRHGGGRGGGRPERRGPQGAPQMGADGWNTVSRTPLKSVDQSIDITKMKLSRQNVDENAIQLGPGGGQNRFSGWGRGSTGGSTGGRPSQEKERRSSNTPNRFSALSRPEEDSSRRYSGVSPARNEGRGRGRGGFGQPAGLGPRRSQEQEREKALSAAMAIGASQSVDGSNRDRSRGRDFDVRKKEEPVGETLLTKEDLEKKMKNIMEEFLHVQDFKEAVLCVSELPKGNHSDFFTGAIRMVLERSSVSRKMVGDLMHHSLKDKHAVLSSCLKSLQEVLESAVAEDMETDAPRVWQYFAEIIGPMVQDGVAPMSFLKDVVQPLIEPDRAHKLLAEVLHDASHREGHKKIAALWSDSGLKWSDYMPANRVDQFLEDKKLEYTKGGDSVPTTPTTGLPLQEIDSRLHELIVSKKADNEIVFDWIESNVDDPTTKQSHFIRILMTAVCNSAIKGDKGKERVEPREISSRGDLLQKYLDHQAESELQALYALQVLVAKLEHPSGVLRQMFDTLYDEDIISEDAFLQWEKSVEEPQGKGAALKQVVQFFTWLREAEDDS